MKLVIPTTQISAQTDWLAASKTIAIELVFLGSSAAIVTGHSTPEVIQLAAVTGGALGVLRLSDVLANVINVRSFLAKPDSGVVPQPTGTPLIKTQQTNGTGANGASTSPA